eukprot:2483572-Prymnesium_polylepis.4
MPPLPRAQRLQKLDDAHLGVVTPAVAVAEHARVAAIALGVALRDLLKQRVHQLLVVHVGDRLAAGVKGAILRERDHVVGGLANLLAPAERRLDAAVADELSREAAQQRLALVCRLVQLLETVTVALRAIARARERSGRTTERYHPVMSTLPRSYTAEHLSLRGGGEKDGV